MRIVQVHSDDLGGGAEAVARAHHGQMLALGMHARLMVARKRTRDAGVEQIPYVRGSKGLRRAARWLEAKTGRQYLYEPSFRALVASLAQDADVVHVHSLHGAGGYAELAQVGVLARRVPTLLSMHDLWWLTGHCAHPRECMRWHIGCGQCPDLTRTPAIPRDGTRANFRAKQEIAASANLHLIAPSSWVREQVAQSPVLRHLSTSVVFNPVDTTVNTPSDRRQAREKLGLPTDRRILLVVAQYLRSPFKGVDELLAALANEHLSNVQLVLMGRDSEAVASESGLAAIAVPFIDDRVRLADYYRAADLLLMPSRVETFGMVAAEAMACGTPIIAFPAGGLADVMRGGEGGILVEQDDMRGFIAATKTVLGDDELHRKLAVNAAARGLREFSLHAHTKACLRLYQEHSASFRNQKT